MRKDLPAQPATDGLGVPTRKEMRMYAVPVLYEEIYPAAKRPPFIVSRRLNRPRRSKSHFVKAAGRRLHRCFRNAWKYAPEWKGDD